ncbi:hypothetical protein CYMTET_28954, partial [Cymbomonas tetramitiformis]
MEEVGGVNAPVAARILFDSAIKEVEVQRDQVAAEKEGLRKEVIALKDALMEEKKMSGIVVGQLQDAIIKSKETVSIAEVAQRLAESKEQNCQIDLTRLEAEIKSLQQSLVDAQGKATNAQADARREAADREMSLRSALEASREAAHAKTAFADSQAAKAVEEANRKTAAAELIASNFQQDAQVRAPSMPQRNGEAPSKTFKVARGSGVGAGGLGAALNAKGIPMFGGPLFSPWEARSHQQLAQEEAEVARKQLNKAQ